MVIWLGQGKAKLHCSGGTINYPAAEGTSRKGSNKWYKLREIAQLNILPKEKLPFTLYVI